MPKKSTLKLGKRFQRRGVLQSIARFKARYPGTRVRIPR